MAHAPTHSGQGIARADAGGRAVAVAPPLGVQAFWILRITFTLIVLVAGVDKFFMTMADWHLYLAPWIPAALNLEAQTVMYGVGVVEIVAGLGVAMFPRIFAYVVAAWLLGIIINLLSIPGYYDIALRDAGLMLAALALGRLSHVYAHRRSDTTPAVA
jgi:uncharacterized membrane protein YphA (DoxX/SURF4 family)